MVFVLAALVLILMAFVGITFQRLAANAHHERLWASMATEVQVDSQRLSKSAGEAALGNLEAFGSSQIHTPARMQTC